MTDATRADADRFDNKHVDVVGPRTEDDDLLDPQVRDDESDDLVDPDRDETTLDTPETDRTATGAAPEKTMPGEEMPDDDTAMHDTAMHDTAMHDTAMHDTAMRDTATDDVDGLSTTDTATSDTATTDTVAKHAGSDDTTTLNDPTTTTNPAAGTAPDATTSAVPVATPAAATPAAATRPGDAELLPANDIDQYQTDWRTVQSGFVDDPAGAVRDADALVGRLVDMITSRIAERRSALSAQRSDDSGEHTEQLRQALRDYRTMFQQLLPAQRS